MTNYQISITVVGHDKASGPLGSVKGALGGLGTIAGGILTAGALTAIGRQIVDLGSQALDSYANFERLGLALQSLVARELLNSGEAENMAGALDMASGMSQELLGWIEKLAIQSPFTQEGVAAAFQQAMAYGFTADESKRLTQAMIDYAAGSGKSAAVMDRISLALGQIKARGNLAGQEINQLTEAGIPVRQILAKAFNVTTAELVEMQEKGLIPADKAIEAITKSLEEDFGGAAARQAGTFSGLVSSLSDIKTIGLRNFFEGTFKAIQPYVQSFVDKLSSPAFMESLNLAGERLGNMVSRVLELVNNMKGFNLAEKFGNIGEYLLKGIAVLSSGGLLLGIGSALGNGLITGLALAFPAAKGLLGNALKNMFTASFLYNGGIIGTLFEVMIATPLMRIGQRLGPILTPLFAKFAGFAKFLTPLTSVLGSFASIAGPIALVALAVMTVVGAFQMLKSGEMTPYIERMQTAFDALSSVFKQFLPALKDAGETLSTAFLAASEQLAQNVIPWLVTQFEKLSAWFIENKPLIEDFINALVTFIVDHLLPAITGLWQVIEPLLTGIVDLVLGLAKTIMQIATGDWAGAWETIKQTVANAGLAIGEAVYGFLNWIANLMGSSLSEIGAVWSSNWNMLKQINAKIMYMIGAYLRSSLKNIGKFLGSSMKELGNDWKENWEKFKSILEKVWMLIKSAVEKYLNDVRNNIVNKVRDISDFWRTSWNSIRSELEKVWNTMVSVVRSMVNQVVSIVTNAINTVRSIWESGWNAIRNFVAGIWNSIVSTINNAINAVVGAVRNIINNVRSVWESGWNAVKSFVSTAWANIVSTIQTRANEIIAKVTSLIDNIKNTFTVDKFVTVGKAIIDGIKQGISNAWNSLVDFLVSKMRSLVSDAMGAINANSPSRAFMKIGNYIVQGLALGIEQMSLRPKMALDNVLNGFTGGKISSLSSYVNNNTDQSQRYYAPVYVTVEGGNSSSEQILKMLKKP